MECKTCVMCPNSWFEVTLTRATIGVSLAAMAVLLAAAAASRCSPRLGVHCTVSKSQGRRLPALPDLSHFKRGAGIATRAARGH